MPGGQFGYQPALDGLRGVAVTLVLLFHGGFAWMGGGYVGVSVFFTLSGFLITSLLILEHQRTGRVSWSAFVARRAKRLLPASLLCLVAISLLAWSGEFAGVPHLRRDVTAAALQVANWNALHGSGSYADLLSRSAGLRSPVDHYWSLAVEEQFYWIWPFAFLALMRVSKGRVRLFANLAGLAVVGVVAARLIALQWGPDAAYWATPARLGEILVGAALAAGCLLWQRRPRGLGLLGLAGLACVLWAAVRWPTSGGPAYAGWFGVFSLASAALILGLQVAGPLRTAFSVVPLVWLGRISYGVYVFHWPVNLLVTTRSVHLDGWALFGLRTAITLAIALVSYFLLEVPVRRSRLGSRLSLTLGLPATVVVVLFAVLVVPAEPGRRHVASAAATTSSTVATTTTVAAAHATTVPAATGRTTTTTSSSTSVPATTTTVLPSGPVNVVLLGDSTSIALLDGLDAWAAETTDRTVGSVAHLGCGLITDAAMLGDTGDEFVKGCRNSMSKDLPRLLSTNHPDTALIMVTMPDVTMRQWSGDEGMLAISDPRYTERMLADYKATADTLIAAGVRHIAVVAPPPPADWWLGWESEIETFAGDTWTRYSAMLDALAEAYPGVVEVVRLDRWFDETGATNDEAMRGDGLHLTPAGALRVMDEFLGPVLLRLTLG